jgi:hypothetical protein
MFNFTSGRSALLLGAAILFGTSAAYATPSLTTQAAISFYDNTGPYYSPTTVDSHSSATGAAVTSQYTGDFTGLNSYGNTLTSHLVTGANASAQYGTLKTSTALSVLNPINNASNPSYKNTDGTINPLGVPDELEADASAILQDTLALDASSAVSTLRLTFHLDGNINIADAGSPFMGASINIRSADHTVSYFNSVSAGTVNQDVNVDLDVTDPAAIDVAIEMLASSTAILDQGSLTTGTYVLNADFYNTFALTGITAFDANGGAVTLNGLMGGSGTNYLALVGLTPPPSSNGVPEPATLALFGAGVAGLGWGRRRAKKQA